MKKYRRILFICTIILSLIGIIMIYSASSIWSNYRFNDSFHYAKMQSIYFIIGLFCMIFISKVDINNLKKKSNLILGICFILLILVLIPGIGKLRNGSRSWFQIGPFGMQPSEFAKLGLIIFASKYLSNNINNIKDIKKSIFPLLLIILIFFGLIMLEPDFGSGMVIVLTLLIMIFSSGTKLSFFVILGLLGLLGISGLVIIAPYRMKRIVAFLNPWADPLGSGYQIIQSLFAISPAGVLGLGFGNSIQKQFYLPEPQTDFIFAILLEEFGLFGGILIVSLYGLLLYSIINIALKQNDLFNKFLCIGLGIQIVLQATLNLCVVVGLIPVTGVTLPFLSYGGSSLLITLCSIGIILNISRYQR